MPNQFLVLGTLGAIGWLLVSLAPSERTAEPQPTAVTAAARAPSIVPDRTPHLEARHAPVPLLRSVPDSPASPAAFTSTAPSITAPDEPAEDELGKKAAKTAAEVDGYRNVSIVGRTGSGAWRAKAYRGTTEVLLTVDGTGRVSTE
jgi:hypothetical protein